MNQKQTQRLKSLGMQPIAAGSAFLFALACRHFACRDYALLGPGPTGLLPTAAFAIIFYGWVIRRSEEVRRPEPLVRFVAHSLWALPLGVLGGRFLGSAMGLCLFDNGIGAFAGLGIGMLAVSFFVEPEPATRFEHVRGTKLHTEPSADERRPEIRRSAVPTQADNECAGELLWLNQPLPPAVARGNFVVIGTIGTGKTLIHRELMAGVVAGNRRVIVYDVKRDLVGHLLAMGVSPNDIVIMNPFDDRAFAWDIAQDLTNHALAHDYAKAFIPDNPGETQPFFRTAAQMLLSGVLQALMLNAPGRWTLRDVMHLTATPTLLRQTLLSHKETATLVDRFFEPQDTFRSVLSTLSNALVPLRSIAAIWEIAGAVRKVSLSQWAESGEKVLVMGASFDMRETMIGINRVMFNVLADKLLSGPERPGENRTWFFIDELKEAQRLDALPRLLTNGRSKGVRCVLGLQDREGLQAVYGEHEANEMLGLCHNMSFLKLSSSQTAQWASDQLGVEERYEYLTSNTTADERRRRGETLPTGESLTARPVAYPSELMGLEVSRDGWVEGYHVVPEHPEGHRVRRSKAWFPFCVNADADHFRPRVTAGVELLGPWTEEDARRLNLSGDDAGTLSSPQRNTHEQPVPKKAGSTPASRLAAVGRVQIEDR